MKKLSEKDFEWIKCSYPNANWKPSYKGDTVSFWEGISLGRAVFKWNSEGGFWVADTLHLLRCHIDGSGRTLGVCLAEGEDACPQDNVDEELPTLSEEQLRKLGEEYLPNSGSFWIPPSTGHPYGQIGLRGE